MQKRSSDSTSADQEVILVVDPAAMFRELAAVALQQHGYGVEAVAGADEALRQIKRSKPALILINDETDRDDVLPFLSDIRRRHSAYQLPAIVIIDKATKGKVVELAKRGISGLLLKSNFSFESLIRDIERSLASSKTRTGRRLARSAEAGRDFSKIGAADLSHVVIAPALADRPREALGTLEPLMSEKRAQQHVDACEQIHGLSPTVMLLIQLTNDPNCSTQQVATAIRRDHALALKIMKMANSVAFSRGAPVSTIQSAVIHLGMKHIRRAAMSLGVIETFSARNYGGLINPGLFWEHAIGCGLLAASLAQRVKDVDPGAAFLAGLLHDVGRLVLFEQIGDPYIRVFKTAQHYQLPLERVESQLLHLNHASVMDRILHHWKFPKELIRPIMLHHHGETSIRHAGHETMPAAVLILANRLAHALLLGDSGDDQIHPVNKLIEILNLKEKQVLDAVDDATTQALDMKLALLNQVHSAEWPQVSEMLLAECDQPLRPLFVGRLGHADAYGLFCQQIGEVDLNDQAPNLAVVHVTEPAEQVSLGQQLMQLEQQAGVDPLPTLVLSSKGEANLVAKGAENRIMQPLATPASAQRIVQTLRRLQAQAAAAAN